MTDTLESLPGGKASVFSAFSMTAADRPLRPAAVAAVDTMNLNGTPAMLVPAGMPSDGSGSNPEAAQVDILPGQVELNFPDIRSTWKARDISGAQASTSGRASRDAVALTAVVAADTVTGVYGSVTNGCTDIRREPSRDAATVTERGAERTAEGPDQNAADASSSQAADGKEPVFLTSGSSRRRSALLSRASGRSIKPALSRVSKFDNLGPSGKKARVKVRWNKALEKARSDAAEQVAKRRPSTKRHYQTVLRLSLVELAITSALATVGMLIEGDEFYQRYGRQFDNGGRMSQMAANFAASWWLNQITFARLGYGDVLPCTTAGRALMMAAHLFVSFPLHVQVQIELFQAMTGSLQWVRLKLGGQRVKYFKTISAAVLYAAYLLLLGLVWMAVSHLGNGDRWSFLDGVWYTWQTTATVGYGDLGILDMDLAFVYPLMLLSRATYLVGYALLNVLMVAAITSTWQSREFSRSNARYRLRLRVKRVRSVVRRNRRALNHIAHQLGTSISSIGSSIWRSIDSSATRAPDVVAGLLEDTDQTPGSDGLPLALHLTGKAEEGGWRAQAQQWVDHDPAEAFAVPEELPESEDEEEMEDHLDNLVTEGRLDSESDDSCLSEDQEESLGDQQAAAPPGPELIRPRSSRRAGRLDTGPNDLRDKAPGDVELLPVLDITSEEVLKNFPTLVRCVSLGATTLQDRGEHEDGMASPQSQDAAGLVDEARRFLASGVTASAKKLHSLLASVSLSTSGRKRPSDAMHEAPPSDSPMGTSTLQSEGTGADSSDPTADQSALPEAAADDQSGAADI